MKLRLVHQHKTTRMLYKKDSWRRIGRHDTEPCLGESFLHNILVVSKGSKRAALVISQNHLDYAEGLTRIKTDLSGRRLCDKEEHV